MTPLDPILKLDVDLAAARIALDANPNLDSPLIDVMTDDYIRYGSFAYSGEQRRK